MMAGPEGRDQGRVSRALTMPSRLQSLLLISSGLPEIPKVEFESFSFKVFFPPKMQGYK